MKNRFFWNCLLAGCLILVAEIGFGRGLDQDCWFAADFDSPAFVNGGTFPADIDGRIVTPGRCGKGCHFHGETENRLPAMAEFLNNASNFFVRGETKLTTGATLKSSGGTFGLKSRAMPVRSRTPWNYKQTAYTCSCYVKGRAGETVTLRAFAEPLTDDELKRIAKHCNGNFDKPSKVAMRPDISSNRVWKLTGEWQRVHAFVRFDHRAKFTGRRVGLEVSTDSAAEFRDFQFQQTDEHPRWGRTAPSPCIDGGKRLKPVALATTDPFFLKNFPAAIGSCAAWVRVPEESAPTVNLPLWGFKAADNSMVQCASNWLQLPGSPKVFIKDFPPPSAGWRHVAWIWSNEVVRAFVDGKACAVSVARLGKSRPQFSDGKSFACGALEPGEAKSEAILDDVAIFSRALSDGEIAALASAHDGLLAHSEKVWMQPIDMTVYFRNQTNAALRTPVWTVRGVKGTIRTSIGGVKLPEQSLALAAGAAKLVVPFDPAQFAVGKYPFAVTLVDTAGKTVAESSGELEIKPRLERDAFRIFSWGGWKPIRDDFLDLIGVNAVNCPPGRGDLRGLARRGVFANIDYENSRKQDEWEYDWQAMAAKAHRELAYAEGLHNWVSTLINSEVYGAGRGPQAAGVKAYRDLARRELGCEPEWSFIDGTDEVDWRKLGKKPPTGIFDGNDRTYRTLYWLLDSGMPVYRLNTLLAQVIHSLSPDNTVWTEPSMSVGGIGRHLDMMADWIYEHDANVTLSQLREQYAWSRALGKKYQPTVSTYYYPKLKGKNPATGKGGVDLCQSADEVIIKSWMALAAVKAESFGIFAADYWQQGVTNAQILAANPKAQVECVGDIDAPVRYGAFMRERYLPAAELLRDMENVRAPIAVMLTAEAQIAGGFWWGHYWYRRALLRILCRSGIPFDVLQEHEITVETLAKYRYVIFPMARLVTTEHDRVLRAAAEKGTRIVMDDCGATFTYPNAIRPGFRYNNDLSDNTRLLDAPFKGWYTNVVDSLRGELAAWSETDGEGAPDSYTFTKAENGVKYVTVVNNKRREGGSILTTFLTNGWYRPVGAPARITTHFQVPEGGCVYEFNSSTTRPLHHSTSSPLHHFTTPPLHLSTFSADYKAADARVFAIYPRPLDKIELKVGGELHLGGKGWVEVTVRDDNGKLAPGRQVVRLTLTAPDGTLRDESGLYRLSGKTRIPLRFARSEAPGGSSGNWKIEVKELTSGLEESTRFNLKTVVKILSAEVVQRGETEERRKW